MTPWHCAGTAIVTLSLTFGAGCGSDDASPVDTPVSSVSPGSHEASTSGQRSVDDQKTLHTGPFEKTFEGIRFSVPAGWKEVELSPAQQGFIDAKFLIPTPHGDVTLTCSSNSGGIETNMQRWIGQFHAPPEKRPVLGEVDVGGKKSTWVELEGEFEGGPMAGAGAAGSGPIERMLGVAIPLGPRDFYLKLTGSSAAVSDVRDSFREFARNGRPLS